MHNLALQWQVEDLLQVYGDNYGGTIWSGGLSWKILALIVSV